MADTPNAADAVLNTEVEYLYRDADNNKRYRRVVLAGAITAEQLATIRGNLDDETFLPDQVGLDTLYEEFGTADAEADHAWHEFVDANLVALPADVEGMDVAAFAAQFDGIVWDITAAADAAQAWIVSHPRPTGDHPDA